jgi:hypothetical protein
MTAHASRSLAEPVRSLPPEFQALRELVQQAQQGEMRLGDPALQATVRDEPPMALPHGLYRSPAAERTAWPPEVRAGLWGLALGLVMLVPLVIFLREPMQKPSAPVAARAVVNQPVAAPVVLAPAPSDVDPLRILNDIEAAERLIRGGDVLAARSALATAAAANSPRALFLMGETYDPNALAAWGTRGIAADTLKARSLYAAANALGHPLAEGRLKGLE